MANGGRSAILPQIHRIFQVGTLAGAADGELLARFAARGDEAAFETLLARHGPLVLGVCRSVLRDPADAEDAFQATLLVLVRKAGSIRLDDSLAPWIYGVATRIALRARSTAARRETRERPASQGEPAAQPGDLDRHDVAPILHEELARLPERLRAPLVLCYLEGLTHDLAAQRLGCPVGTVRSRLARGRDRLRLRLTRRGVALSAGLLAALLGEATAAVVPTALADSTIHAATCVAAGRAALAGAISAPVAAMMEGVLYAMKLTKLKAAAGAAIVAGCIATGVVAQSQKGAADDRIEPVQTVKFDTIEDNRPIGPDGRPIGALTRRDNMVEPPTKTQLLIETKLNEPVSLNIANQPLAEAIAYLANSTGLNIVLDPKALAKAQLTTATRVNLVCSDIRLKNALKLMLNPLGLSYKVEDEVLMITSPQTALSSKMITRSYYVGDFLPPRTKGGPSLTKEEISKVDMSLIIDVISSSVAPGSWRIWTDASSGPSKVDRLTGSDPIGSITSFSPGLSLIIRHTGAVHNEIAERLRQLRRLIDLRAEPATAMKAEPSAGPTAAPPAEAPPASTGPARGERARQLLQELEREIDGLTRERDRLRRDVDSKKAPVQSRIDGLEKQGSVSFFNQTIGLYF